MKQQYPDYETASEWLVYDPETGIFRWKKDRRQMRAGVEAGCSRSADGYHVIRFLDTNHRAHRLAWLLMTGEWPPHGYEIDHIDGDGFNNRWSNLRLATHAQNHHNTKLRRNNTTGVKGVHWRPDIRAYCARVGLNGKRIHVGHFKTLAEAAAARRTATERLHGEFANHG